MNISSKPWKICSTKRFDTVSPVCVGQFGILRVVLGINLYSVKLSYTNCTKLPKQQHSRKLQEKIENKKVKINMQSRLASILKTNCFQKIVATPTRPTDQTQVVNLSLAGCFWTQYAHNYSML